MKEQLNTLYNDIVAMARDQRRQITFRSPKLPLERATREEADRQNALAAKGREYRELALNYRPETNWQDWEQYVRAKLHPEIAEIVVTAILGDDAVGELDWFDAVDAFNPIVPMITVDGVAFGVGDELWVRHDYSNRTEYSQVRVKSIRGGTVDITGDTRGLVSCIPKLLYAKQP